MDSEPNTNFYPTEEEEEAMLVIVRKANPPGIARHYHFERLLKEYETKQRALLQKQSD